MMDDTFKLGNFSDDLGGGTTPSLPARNDSRLAMSGGSPLHEGEKGNSVIEHPTVKSDVQVKFRSPRDGSPLLEIGLEKIVPNEFQPRRIFNEEKLQELAESIKTHGIIQPLVLLNRPDGNFEILVGERRFRAAKIAGLARVPAFVSEGLSSQAKLEIALIENVQRADLNPIEEAKAYQQLSEEFGLTQSQIAARVGKNHSTIANLIRLLNLPAEIQRALVSEEISEGQARPLLSLRDREEMLAMFKIVLREKMKVRDVENKVRDIMKRKIKVREMFTPDPFIESLERELRNKLGTRVEVSKKARGGQITIQFYSDEELKGIVEKLT